MVFIRSPYILSVITFFWQCPENYPAVDLLIIPSEVIVTFCTLWEPTGLRGFHGTVMVLRCFKLFPCLKWNFWKGFLWCQRTWRTSYICFHLKTNVIHCKSLTVHSLHFFRRLWSGRPLGLSVIVSPKCVYYDLWTKCMPMYAPISRLRYFLTVHRAGGEVIWLKSQVHWMADGSWTCFLTSVAQGSWNSLNHGNHLAPDMWGTNVAVQSSKVHPLFARS